MDIRTSKEITDFAAAVTGQGDDDHIPLMGNLNGAQNIFRVAAGGDGNQDVPSLAQGTDLPLKDGSIAVVIGHSSEDGGISIQCDPGQWQSLAFKAPHKLGDEMLGIGGGTTVVAGQDFAVVGQGSKQELHGRGQGLG